MAWPPSKQVRLDKYVGPVKAMEVCEQEQGEGNSHVVLPTFDVGQCKVHKLW